MKVVLDTQHKYKPQPKDNDKGAIYNDVYEADLVDRYFDMITEDREKRMSIDLTQEDIIIIRNNPQQGILTGWYPDRIKWANGNKIDLYFAGHLNAGKGKYGLIEVEEGKIEDYELAKVLVDIFKEKLGNSDFRIKKLSKDDRGYFCIAGSNCPAFLLEPAFLDNPEHFEKLVNGDWCYLIGKVLLKFIRYYKELKKTEVRGVV